MFNYVVKDPNSSRLSGELWIKEQTGLSHKSCVLELWLSQIQPNASVNLSGLGISRFNLLRG